jgi:hypothetical protein
MLIIRGLVRREPSDASVPDGVTPAEPMTRLDDPVARA